MASKTMKTYYRRKGQGLCVDCGQPLNDSKYVKCIKCHDKTLKAQYETRHWYIDNHICPICRKNKIYEKETRCLDCMLKDWAQRNRKPKKELEEMREADKAQKKNKRAEARQNGICTYCFKRKADKGHSLCKWCMAKAREKKRASSALKPSKIAIRRGWTADGKCWFCGQPAIKGYTTCAVHHEIMVERASKGGKISRKRRAGNEHEEQAQI